MTPPDAVLKTVALHAAGQTRYLPLDSVPLGGASDIVLALRLDRGMDDSGEIQQLHLHLSLRVEALSFNRAHPPTKGAPDEIMTNQTGDALDAAASESLAESYKHVNVSSLRAVATDGGIREVRPSLSLDLEQGVSLLTRVFFPTGSVAGGPYLSCELAQDEASHQRDVPAAPSQLDDVRFTKIVVLLDGRALSFYPTPDGSNEPQNALRADLSQGLSMRMRLQPDNGSSPMGPGFVLTIAQAESKP